VLEQRGGQLGLSAIVQPGGNVTEAGSLIDLLDRTSILGGQKIEGIVIKNYNRFGMDKKVLMGKFVSEKYKEVHAGAWRESNPTKTDIIQSLIVAYRTPTRWNKAIQHLRESGGLDGSPKDIGGLIKEVQNDVKAECKEEIMSALFGYAWPQIQRGIVSGLPQWYKDELMKNQFEKGGEAS
jgi:hypothetical protein